MTSTVGTTTPSLEASSNPVRAQPFSHVATDTALAELKQFEGTLSSLSSNKGSGSEDKKQFEYIDWDQIDIQSVLGEGAFSFVFEVSIDNDTSSTTGSSRDNDKEISRGGERTCRSGRKYALKCLKVKAVTDVKSFVTGASDLALEASLLSQLDHEHIISIHGVSKHSVSKSYTGGNGMGYFLLLENVLEETLFDRLVHWRTNEEKGFSNRLLSCLGSHNSVHLAKQKMVTRIDDIALSITSAMTYLHQQGIVYRDLKPQNIGFSNGKVKIFDFGLARDINTCYQGDIAGSICYLAPEVIRGQGTFLSSDVYSFAVVLWELCTMQIPFAKFTSFDELARKVAYHDERPSSGLGGGPFIPSRTLRNLISKCWSSCPLDRPTFDEVHDTLSAVSHKVRASITDSSSHRRTNYDSASVSTAASSFSVSDMAAIDKVHKSRKNHRGNSRIPSWVQKDRMVSSLSTMKDPLMVAS